MTANPINNFLPAGVTQAALVIAPTPSSGAVFAAPIATPEGAQFVSTEGQRKTFRFAFSQALAATPTDVLQIAGSATSTIRIHKLRIAGVAATALQNIEVQALRRSTLQAGGTLVAVTPISMDIVNDGTVTGAGINAFSANGTTLGTLLGTIADMVVPFALKTGTNNAALDIISPNDVNTKPITLHGTADALCLNLAGVTLTNASTIYVDGVYSEDSV